MSKELEKKIADLEAALQKRDEDHAAQLEEAVAAAREEAIATGLRKIPGQVKITLEAQGGGKDTSSYGIRDGHPTVWYSDNSVVASQALMKVATGKGLSEREKELNPSLAAANQQDVLSFLAAMAAKKIYWLVKVAPMLLLLLMLATNASGQIGNGRIFDFYSDGIDTLTNADTLILTVPKDMVDKETYDYAWHVDVTNVSDTTSLTIFVQETMFPNVDDTWVNVDTVAIAGSESVFITGYNVGIRQRLWIRSANTGVSKLYAIVRYRKKA